MVYLHCTSCMSMCISHATLLSQSELKPSVLKKYDEEIEGLKKQTFQLGLLIFS